MKKGEIWLADLNPVKGREQSGYRPVVIVSGNAMNENMPLSIVCPLSTRLKHFIGGIILEPDKSNGLDTPSEILTFQIRTLAHKRFVKKLGEISSEEMTQLIKNINKILEY